MTFGHLTVGYLTFTGIAYNSATGREQTQKTTRTKRGGLNYGSTIRTHERMDGPFIALYYTIWEAILKKFSESFDISMFDRKFSFGLNRYLFSLVFTIETTYNIFDCNVMVRQCPFSFESLELPNSLLIDFEGTGDVL